MLQLAISNYGGVIYCIMAYETLEKYCAICVMQYRAVKLGGGSTHMLKR